MDQDSCHHLQCPCGHHAGPYSQSYPLLSVSPGATPWASDPAGALAADLHLCSVPAGACAAAAHHATVPQVQLQPCPSQIQEEELIHTRAILQLTHLL